MAQHTFIQVNQFQSTCADCPLFKNYQDRGRGLCLVFDKVVRKRHTLTSDCVHQIETNIKEGEYTSYSLISPWKIIKRKRELLL